MDLDVGRLPVRLAAAAAAADAAAHWAVAAAALEPLKP